jgi:hypothetical protein
MLAAAAAAAAVAAAGGGPQPQHHVAAAPPPPPPLAHAPPARPEYVAALEREVGGLRASLDDANARGSGMAAAANAKVAELEAAAAAAAGAAAAEAARLRDEGERVVGENRLLKRAVGLQASKIAGLEGRVGELERTLAAAAEAVRRLEADNYALRHHLAAAEGALHGGGGGGGGRFGGGPGEGLA